MPEFIVNKENIIHNLRKVEAYAAGREIIAVLKCGAYGLGLERMERLLYDHGVRRFSVTELADALRLRSLHGETEILLMDPLYEEAEILRAAEAGVTLTLTSSENAAAVNRVCAARGIFADVQIAVDTGLGRYGFLPGQTAEITDVYCRLGAVRVTGIYSHAYSPGNRRTTLRQASALASVAARLKAVGVEPGLTHFASSGVLFHCPPDGFGAVRVGSAFTGRVPGGEQLGLRPAAQLEAAVSEVRQMKKGSSVGYGAACRLKRDSEVAVIRAGYADGFGLEKGGGVCTFRSAGGEILRSFRHLIDRKPCLVQIKGVSVPVLGSVGASHLMADVTGLGVRPGNAAVLDGNPIFCGNLAAHWKETVSAATSSVVSVTSAPLPSDNCRKSKISHPFSVMEPYHFSV